jgi:TolB-like protein/predicted Zn-dependent protease
VDSRTDVFSLGAVLYEMATGRRPFRSESQAGLVTAILRDTPEPPSRLRPGAPPELDGVIARCLQKEPTARFQTAREVVQALEAVAGGAATAAGRPVAAAASAPARQGIVVLPFVNLSPDRENEFFSDGLTEELITDLSKVKALTVISRTSAMRLKGTEKDVRTIGRELGVAYVLEGSVRRAGPSVRITAQLVDVATDAEIWAEKYTGALDDVFELQERVSREIVKALNVTLTSEEDRRLAQHPVADVRAFELYVQARQEMRGLGAATPHAESLIAKAIEIEGETPPLRALLARTRVARVKAGLSGDASPLDEAEATGRALLASDPGSVDGHVLLAMTEYERGRLDLVVAHCLSALEREPNDADALFHLTVSYVSVGQAALAHETARRFMACDPLAPLAWMCGGAAGWCAGDLEAARGLLAKGLELDPQNYMLRWMYGYTLAGTGRLAEASEQTAWLQRNGPSLPFTRQLVGVVRALEGRPDEALAAIGPVDVERLDGQGVFHLAEPYALAGAHERALDLLDLAGDRGFHPLPYFEGRCPFLAPLHGLPRFADARDRARRRTEEFEVRTRSRTWTV